MFFRKSPELKKYCMAANIQGRVVFLDYLRVIACFMVILVHSIEPFYLGEGGTLIGNASDALWVTILDSALRASVPLFVLASSYLLFPLKYDTSVFFKKRMTRVLIPLCIWAVLYAVVPMYGAGSHDAVAGLGQVLYNFTPNAGHLWFVYMLLGLYLLMPLLSPWIEKVSKRGEQVFIAAWAFTTLVPFIRKAAECVTGSPDLWGECGWNEFGALYYISGFVGYLVIGHYIRTYVGELSWKKTLLFSIPMWIAGYAVTAVWFWLRLPAEYPVKDSIDLALDMETSWRFCTIGVAMTTVAYFLVFRKLTSAGWFYRNVILPVSGLSYGMYLMHMFLLVPIFSIVSGWGIPTPAVMLVTATATFASCVITAKLVSYIPGSKYIIG